MKFETLHFSNCVWVICTYWKADSGLHRSRFFSLKKVQEGLGFGVLFSFGLLCLFLSPVCNKGFNFCNKLWHWNSVSPPAGLPR